MSISEEIFISKEENRDLLLYSDLMQVGIVLVPQASHVLDVLMPSVRMLQVELVLA